MPARAPSSASSAAPGANRKKSKKNTLPAGAGSIDRPARPGAVEPPDSAQPGRPAGRARARRAMPGAIAGARSPRPASRRMPSRSISRRERSLRGGRVGDDLLEPARSKPKSQRRRRRPRGRCPSPTPAASDASRPRRPARTACSGPGRRQSPTKPASGSSPGHARPPTARSRPPRSVRSKRSIISALIRAATAAGEVLHHTGSAFMRANGSRSDAPPAAQQQPLGPQLGSRVIAPSTADFAVAARRFSAGAAPAASSAG